MGANANLTLNPGTAVGWQGQGLSFLGYYSTTVKFDGTVIQPCYFVRCNTVQEADNNGGSSNDGTGIAGSAAYPSVSSVFTRFSALGDLAVFIDANSILTWINNYPEPISNCEFWSGGIGGNVNDAWFLLSNDLLNRTKVSFLEGGSVDLAFQNCTFHGGSLAIGAGVAPGGSIYDCAFDYTDLTGVNTSYGGGAAYNAYVNGANYLPNASPANGDVFVSSSSGFNWLSGPLGNFYLPPHDPSANDGRLLIDAGDQSASIISVVVNGATGASAPLSAFTTQTSQTLDSGLVDIGYHYVPVPFITLTTPCGESGMGVAVALAWSVADVVQQTLSIVDFKIYRSTVAGGPYTFIHTTSDGSQTTYWDDDPNLVSGLTYYYVVTFEYQVSGTIRESPFSNQIAVMAHSYPAGVAADAWWDVTDISDPNNPIHLGCKQAAFGEGSVYSTQYLQQNGLPQINTFWFEGNMWSNSYTLHLTSDQLTHVNFSVAIDNYIIIYLKNANVDEEVVPEHHAPPYDGSPYSGSIPITWSSPQPLPDLVAGDNEIGVVIFGDRMGGSYFSMVITTGN